MYMNMYNEQLRLSGLDSDLSGWCDAIVIVVSSLTNTCTSAVYMQRVHVPCNEYMYQQNTFNSQH